MRLKLVLVGGDLDSRDPRLSVLGGFFYQMFACLRIEEESKNCFDICAFAYDGN